MCGISGSINTSVFTIADKQRHRGPDNFSVNSTFAHNRLSIIDLSDAGNQPMTCGKLEMTFNGEIYNYKQLFSYLNPHDDYGNYTIPGDARVFLKYINRFGIDKALRDANGMWAFGLTDGETITLCVDRFGEKPLYYFSEGDVFAFASCPSALLHLKDKWKINQQALQSYWKLGAVMQGSLWEGIKRVYASEKVTYNIRTKEIKTDRYWQPEYKPNEDLTELILDSIKKVRVADVPVYLYLSGGIDSTLCASQFVGGNAIHMDSPELKYAQQAATKFKINLKTVSPKSICVKEALQDHASKCGEPQAAALIPYLVSKEVKSLGIKVAISSNGADETFGGYNRIHQKVHQEQIDSIFRKVIDYPVPVFEIDERLSSSKWFELQTYVQHDLNKTLDFSSMAHSIEVRNPYLDHRLVAMALSVPHEKHGRKNILKGMLKNMGFDDHFLNRNKMGFSLYVEPDGFSKMKKDAFEWCIKRGYLKLNKLPLSGRDSEYLQMASLSFYHWYEVFENKIV